MLLNHWNGLQVSVGGSSSSGRARREEALDEWRSVRASHGEALPRHDQEGIFGHDMTLSLRG
jgi:hypothetical protein